MPDHAVAVRRCLEQLTDPRARLLEGRGEVAAIGFKAVHGGRVSGVQRVTPDVLAAMEEMSHVAPAHNPPYIAAMRLLSEKLPEIPLVAAFETGFHQTIPDRQSLLCRAVRMGREVPRPALGISRRQPSLHRRRGRPNCSAANDLRIISCHLGGSSSLCAIRDGQSVATQHGHEPADRACRRTTASAISIRSRLPVIMQAHGQVAGRSAGRRWPSGAACWA